MSTTGIFLIAMAIIFTVPYLIWRVGRTEYYALLVVVQIITGILLGAGRSLDHRLAAANQGADHDHFRRYPARQGHHHQ